jgi:competence ComEA-like helix-hairpin-helix protein
VALFEPGIAGKLAKVQMSFDSGKTVVLLECVCMDINKASAEELERAFQVDGLRARYIVDERDKLGGFKSWDDVKKVPGFEDKMVENLQSAGLTIGKREARESTDKAHVSQAAGRDNSRDLNKASAEELERVSQIDGERARYLVEARNRVGGFKSWDDLKREAVSFEDGMVERLQKAGFTLKQ